MLECEDLVEFLLERAYEALLVVFSPVFGRCLETCFELVVCNVGMVVVLNERATELLTESGGWKLSVERHWKMVALPRTCTVPHLAGFGLGLITQSRQHQLADNTGRLSAMEGGTFLFHEVVQCAMHR